VFGVVLNSRIKIDKGVKENIMLVLTRRVGEALMVGEDITVTVLGANANQVKLGIAAPREIDVHREEVFRRVKCETSNESDEP